MALHELNWFVEEQNVSPYYNAIPNCKQYEQVVDFKAQLFCDLSTWYIVMN